MDCGLLTSTLESHMAGSLTSVSSKDSNVSFPDHSVEIPTPNNIGLFLVLFSPQHSLYLTYYILFIALLILHLPH